VKLLAEKPIRELSLRSAVVYTVTWTKTTSRQTGGSACVMTVVKPGKLQSVTGIWKGTGVDHWTFGPTTRAVMNAPPVDTANVRLLADGRVTKIYRR
jgi:hypothetical protein